MYWTRKGGVMEVQRCQNERETERLMGSPKLFFDSTTKWQIWLREAEAAWVM
jgi:hypothetical protein